MVESDGIVAASVQSPHSFRFGPFEADPETGELRKSGRRLRLQEKPFQVLIALLERRGNLISRKALHERLWPGDTFVDFENGLNTAISKLREVLGDSAKDHRYIETLARRGGSDEAPETRTMSSMGRIPAIGSLANGKAMATAPTSFPSI